MTTNLTPISYEFSRKEWAAQYAQSLNSLVKDEDIQTRVVELKKNVFYPSQWRQLEEEKAVAQKFLNLQKHFVPGMLWVQKGLQGAIVHWVQEDTLYRAFLLDNHVKVNSYTACKASYSATLTRGDFQEQIHNYLQAIEIPTLPPTNEEVLQRQLEIIPIIFKVSASACAKFKEFQTQFPQNLFGLAVLFGIPARTSNKYSFVEQKGQTILQISKRFFIGRLVPLNDETPEDYTKEEAAQVGGDPANHKIPKNSQQVLLAGERKVENLTQIEDSCMLSLNNLQPLLQFRFGEERIERAFKHRLFPCKGTQSFELEISMEKTELRLSSTLYYNPPTISKSSASSAAITPLPEEKENKSK